MTNSCPHSLHAITIVISSKPQLASQSTQESNNYVTLHGINHMPSFLYAKQACQQKSSSATNEKSCNDLTWFARVCGHTNMHTHVLTFSGAEGVPFLSGLQCPRSSCCKPSMGSMSSPCAPPCHLHVIIVSHGGLIARSTQFWLCCPIWELK